MKCRSTLKENTSTIVTPICVLTYAFHFMKLHFQISDYPLFSINMQIWLYDYKAKNSVYPQYVSNCIQYACVWLTTSMLPNCWTMTHKLVHHQQTPSCRTSTPFTHSTHPLLLSCPLCLTTALWFSLARYHHGPPRNLKNQKMNLEMKGKIKLKEQGKRNASEGHELGQENQWGRRQIVMKKFKFSKSEEEGEKIKFSNKM